MQTRDIGYRELERLKVETLLNKKVATVFENHLNARQELLNENGVPLRE
jgi:hypothetical protein